MTRAQISDFPECVVELRKLSASSKLLDCGELVMRGTACANEVRVVGVRQSVRTCACCSHHRLLLEREDDVVRACGSEDCADLLGSFCICDRVASTVVHAKLRSFMAGDVRNELCSLRGRRADLEVEVTRSGHRSCAEKGSAQIRAAATRSRHDAARRVVERASTLREDAGVAQNAERCPVSGDMQLIPRRTVEGVSTVGPDLGRYSDATEEREPASRGCGRADVEVYRNISASA